MINSTTTTQTKIPAIIMDYNEKCEVRSIEDIFPEYTNSKAVKYNDIIIDVINKWITNLDRMETRTTSLNDKLGEFMNLPYFVTKKNISTNGNIYEFLTDFIYVVKCENNMYIAENEFFNIFGYGETIEEAENELFSCIEDLWNVYVEEENENLDGNAIILKDKIINSIRKR